IADYGREWELEGVEIRNVGGMEQLDRTQTAKNGSPIAYPQLLLELIRRVDAYKPDVIHVFKPKGFAGAAGTYFMLRGHRVVLDCDDWEGWGGWNEEKSYPWIVKEYIDRQERWMIHRAPALTVASRTLADRARMLRKPANDIFYVPNCGASAAGRNAQ